MDTAYQDGALYMSNRTSDYGGAATTKGAGYYRIHFDASRSNPIYGASDTVKPPSIGVSMWIRQPD